IGGGLEGGLVELLADPSLDITYVEPDPEVIDVLRRSNPDLVPDDPRLRLEHTDGRRFMARSNDTFDIITVALGDPANALINRCYTTEFFELARQHLTSEGLISIGVTGAENVYTDIHAAYLTSLYRTIQTTFTRVIALPGPVIRFFAGDGSYLTGDLDTLARRCEQRCHGKVFNPLYLSYRFTPERIAQLMAALSRQTTHINRDTRPVSYLYNLAFWSSQYSGGDFRLPVPASDLPVIPAAAASLLLIIISMLLPVHRSCSRCMVICLVLIMGCTFIGLEFLQLIAYQTRLGMVYSRLSLLLAAFMVGISLGSRLMDQPARRTAHPRRLSALVLSGIGMACLLTPGLMYIPEKGGLTWELLFGATIVMTGCLEGLFFPLALRLYNEVKDASPTAAGMVYGADLAGASAGAMIISIVVFPLLGMWQVCAGLALLNILAAVMAARLP
ncbi:hypothetical protein JW905_08810, partial [bacterium]|nr:hypothetical protein [candidate division CSSED10-310 bacterium]